jgi:hypothetical protein
MHEEIEGIAYFAVNDHYVRSLLPFMSRFHFTMPLVSHQELNFLGSHAGLCLFE